MDIKDYYRILEVSPVASSSEIKKSFRALALKYHPDKNPNNTVAELHFKEIQEAYEILSNPKTREEYNYKRWYNRSIGKEFSKQPNTPVAILAAVDKLSAYVASVGIFQIDYLSLSTYIHQLLNEDAIRLLQQFDNEEMNTKIVKAVLQASQPLPYIYSEAVVAKLVLLQAFGNENKMLKYFLAQQRLRDWWKRYQLLVVTVAALLVCILLFWIGR